MKKTRDNLPPLTRDSTRAIIIDQDLVLLENPRNVRFKELLRICRHHFGEPRIRGSHFIFKMPWQGDPRINIQCDGKLAKPYPVRVVCRALELLKGTFSHEPKERG